MKNSSTKIFSKSLAWLALASIFLFAVAGQTNIRVGRSGGGLAEMKAYAIVNQLPSILKVCIASQVKCGMNMGQLQNIVNLQNQVDLSRVQLVAPYNGPSKYSNYILSINSQDLYTDGRPNGFGQILALTLEILLRDALKIGTESIWPRNLFSGLKENIRSLDLGSSDRTLHAISLESAKPRDILVQALALEFPMVTVDLTPHLLSNMACNVQPSWNVEGWNFTPGQNWVRVRLLWTCGNQLWSGELQMIINGENIERFEIFRRTPIR